MKYWRILACFWLIIAYPGHANARGPQSAIVKELVKADHSWDGAALPAYPAGKPEVTILQITIPPGVQLPLHQHPIINAGVLIRGTLTVVTKNGKTLRMKAGDPIVEVVDTWHYGKNEGVETAEIIVFYAGTAGSPLSIKEQ